MFDNYRLKEVIMKPNSCNKSTEVWVPVLSLQLFTPPILNPGSMLPRILELCLKGKASSCLWVFKYQDNFHHPFWSSNRRSSRQHWFSSRNNLTSSISSRVTRGELLALSPVKYSDLESLRECSLLCSNRQRMQNLVWELVPCFSPSLQTMELTAVMDCSREWEKPQRWRGY